MPGRAWKATTQTFSQHFKWGAPEQDAFKALKSALIQGNLAYFDSTKRTELLVDAGLEASASLTTQIISPNETSLVKCDSHAFSPAERNYSDLEKEAFACVWALKINHIYIYGCPVTCITDALAVKKIFEEDNIRKKTPIRFIRWKSEISMNNVLQRF